MTRDLPFVIVEWDDAWKADTEEATLESAHESHRPIRCSTAGWLLRDDDIGVQVANEHSPNGTFRGRSFIPRAMVVTVSPLKLTKPKQRKPKLAPKIVKAPTE